MGKRMVETLENISSVSQREIKGKKINVSQILWVSISPLWFLIETAGLKITTYAQTHTVTFF